MMKRHEVEKMFKDRIEGMDDASLAELSYEFDMDIALMWDQEFGYFLVDDEIVERCAELDANAISNGTAGSDAQ